ncbi:hypothetical protein JOF53_003935 [Crossiella equi]|uniref:TNT domain-containing protein n=1 Tax=Crossiella equi TaxID=130796 RepID=A0ABS5AEP0_9PSEU|nr:TNT domain-containing protein [Crossiella equi]MBP2475063.1 hypothetical protein [Crossiella equi]
MRGRQLLATLSAAVLLPLGAASPALASTAAEACAGAFQGDGRLGPETLPKVAEHPVGRLVAGYQRFGRLGAADFLAKYWDTAAGGWKYPPADGFLLRPDGTAVKKVHRLLPGYQLDRFGNEGGQVLSPTGAHYSKRSLPPQGLLTPDAGPRCDYHRYRVAKEFHVWQGTIAPWFEQGGRGSRVKLDRQLLPGPGNLTVAWLVDNGFLTRV